MLQNVCTLCILHLTWFEWTWHDSSEQWMWDLVLMLCLPWPNMEMQTLRHHFCSLSTFYFISYYRLASPLRLFTLVPTRRLLSRNTLGGGLGKIKAVQDLRWLRPRRLPVSKKRPCLWLEETKINRLEVERNECFTIGHASLKKTGMAGTYNSHFLCVDHLRRKQRWEIEMLIIALDYKHNIPWNGVD